MDCLSLFIMKGAHHLPLTEIIAACLTLYLQQLSLSAHSKSRSYKYNVKTLQPAKASNQLNQCKEITTHNTIKRYYAT